MHVRENIAIWNDKRYPKTVEENVKILTECIRFCHSKSVIPIIIMLPRPFIYREYFSKQIIGEFYNIMNDLVSKEHVNFINYFAWNEINNDDFYDVNHLNINGGKKLSKAINDYIMSNFEK